MSLFDALTRSLGSRPLLFCGAGFSATCLNFNEDDLGVAGPLLSAFNRELNYDFTDLSIAADAYIEKNGNSGLFTFLKSRFSVREIDENINRILAYPWARIYTTNYDAAIEDALTKNAISHYSVDRTEVPHVLESAGPPSLKIAHIHGFERKWTLENFTESCVIDSDSYLRASAEGEWNAKLREDLASASIVVFAGFSNSDFYITQQIRSITTIREKTHFVNYEGAVADRELHLRQGRYGAVHNIGLARFSSIISEIDPSGRPERPNISSFDYYQHVDPTAQSPSISSKKRYYVGGNAEPSHVALDHINYTNEYRARRTLVDEVLRLDLDRKVILVRGGISSGKSQALDELSYALSTAGRTVVRFRRSFQNTSNEIASLLEAVEHPVFVIDNVSRAPDVLERLLQASLDSSPTIILSSRSVAAENLELLARTADFGFALHSFDVEKLDADEAERLAKVIDNVCRWPEAISNWSGKKRFVQNDCSSRLANVLLYLFDSESIRDKILLEIDAFEAREKGAKEFIIISLVLVSMGLPAKIDSLSELVHRDAYELANRLSKISELVIISALDSSVTIFPGIVSREILRSVIDDNSISVSLARAVRRIAGDAFYSRELRSLAKSIARQYNLSKVIKDPFEIERFYDEVSLEPIFSGDPNFWLQLSIHFRQISNIPEAWHYLNRALDEVENIRSRGRQFDPFQIRDQECRLLLTDPSRVSLDSLKAAARYVNKQLAKQTFTAHTFTTIELFREFAREFSMAYDRRSCLLAVRELASLKDALNRASDRVPSFLKPNVQQASSALQDAARHVYEA